MKIFYYTVSSNLVLITDKKAKFYRNLKILVVVFLWVYKILLTILYIFSRKFRIQSLQIFTFQWPPKIPVTFVNKHGHLFSHVIKTLIQRNLLEGNSYCFPTEYIYFDIIVNKLQIY